MRAFWSCAALLALWLAPPLRADELKKEEPKKEEPKKEEKKEGKTFEVPYRLTKTQHILVRAKINGKGPYNFIIDTGAPTVFLATAVAKKLDIEPDKKGWGNFDKFELEGGVVVEKAKARIEDPFQLKGMNGLGLAGVELHGVIGYTMLARYRMEFDFRSDKMKWTELNFDPPAPEALGGKAEGVDAMASLVEFALFFLSGKPKPEIVARGFLGLELTEGKEGVVVKSVLDKGPAGMAGVKAGDRITKVGDELIKNLVALHKEASKFAAGETVTLTVERDGKTQEITVKAGEGL